MDGNGFTGFNPELAQANIENFYNSCLNTANLYLKAYQNLFSKDVGLVNVWCSPNAVEFSKKYIPLFEELYGLFMKEMDADYDCALRAYNTIASQNNMSLLRVGTPGSIGYGIGGYTYLDSQHPKTGVVGINRQLANMVLENFKNDISACFESFDEIPTSIALYDDENSQQHAFRTNVEKFKSKFMSSSGELYIELRKAIESELDSNRLAKQQSVDVLNG